ncbi:MAG: Anaerobic magnesium-protoporphyrin IX monomethyl ester cyclase [Myxococcota bacterium]|nr:Anaerobic magnesium-protoporphyrin IX monomethyl ester cyclase [Myxococcota bacterium]
MRDGYCCTPAKGYFFWHPLDLLIQSGWLSRLGTVLLLDAVARGLGTAQALDEALRFRPDAVFTLSGSLTRAGDRRFLSALRERLPAVRIIGSGDELRYETIETLRAFPELDGALTDFTSPDLSRWIESPASAPGPDLVVRAGDGFAGAPKGNPRRVIEDARFEYPLPRQDLFVGPEYRIPSSPRRFASVLTSYGCNQPCTYCSVSRLGAKLREPESVEEEILRLRRDQAVSHVFFRDATLTMDREHILNLCARLRRSCPWLTFNGWTRVDLVDGEVIREMKAAGLRLLSFGLESGDDQVLRRNGKTATARQAADALALCRLHGVRTLGHFVVGLPGETPESFQATLRWIESLPLDYAAFTVAEPRPGTLLKRKNHQHEDLALARRRHAEAIRGFYLRPSLWVHHARRLRTPPEAASLIREARDFVRIMLLPA